jgi:YlmC/YmxH family sporulation protein
MVRIFDMRQKEVINTTDGCRFGFSCDVEIDVEGGRIASVIVPGPGRIFGVFGREQEYCIPWDCVKQVGDDIILVDVETDKVTKNC